MILGLKDRASLSDLITGIPGPGLSVLFNPLTATVIPGLVIVNQLEGFQQGPEIKQEPVKITSVQFVFLRQFLIGSFGILPLLKPFEYFETRRIEKESISCFGIE
jgi:hypothetical protein